MTIETSTVNALMVAVLALQCWLVREVFKLQRKISIIIAHCNHCPKELDTDRITKQT